MVTMPVTEGPMKYLQSFLRDENGTETMEYALVASLIVLAVVVAIAAIGPQVVAMYERLSGVIP
jgi:Flp pilus assembly pilin Flp